jgi:hypothetical protein
MIDQFTHDIFTAGGGPASHAIPDSAHALSLPPVRPLLTASMEYLRELVQDAVRDCLIAFSAVGTFIRMDTMIAIFVVLLIACVVEYVCRRIRREHE